MYVRNPKVKGNRAAAKILFIFFTAKQIYVTCKTMSFHAKLNNWKKFTFHKQEKTRQIKVYSGARLI